MALLIALLTFIVVVALVLAVWLLLSSETNQKMIRSRMEAVRRLERGGGTETELALRLMRDDMLSSVPFLNRLLMRLSWSLKLQEFISQAGLEMKPAKVLQLSGISALLMYIIVSHFVHVIGVGVLAGILAAGIPLGVIGFIRNRRLHRFEQFFPEALDLLGRAVRAGHAFTTGLEMVSKESPEPVASEFRTAFEEQNFGLPLRDALLNMAKRVPLVDVQFLITTLLVQKDTGGNLAEILDELARVIRERFRIYRDVHTRTAQGRLTAVVLMAMPIAMLLLMSVLNPTYIHVLYDDPWGPPALAGAALLQIVGAMIIWKIVNIEV